MHMAGTQAQRLHIARCARPALGTCSEKEFEADLYAFLEQRGEEQLALKLRNKQITWWGPAPRLRRASAWQMTVLRNG